MFGIKINRFELKGRKIEVVNVKKKLYLRLWHVILGCEGRSDYFTSLQVPPIGRLPFPHN